MDPSVPPAPRPWTRHLWPAAVALLTFAAFLPSLGGEFLNWDDDANFVSNPRYRGLGPENLKWMFTDHFGHYMPLTWLSLGADYLLWGMNPRGYHATSMLLHSLNAVLFFFLLRTLIGRARPDSSAGMLDASAAAGALFFSLHPLRAESVAWITERRDVVAGAFFLLALLAYVRMAAEAAGSPARRKWLWLSAASYAGMILSKAMGMTLPLVLLVLDAAPLRRYAAERPSALLKEKIPFFVLMIAAVAVTSFAQNHAEAIYDRSAYPLVQSFAQPGYRISFYLLKTLWPFSLSPLYWFRPDLGLPQVLGWLAVLSLTGLLVLRRRALPGALAAWIAYLLLIAPVAGIFQAGPHFAADRYTYFACLPFAALFGATLPAIPSRWGVGIGAAVLVGLAALTSRQCLVWKDSVALWTRAIELDPDVYFSHQRRGLAFAVRGQWNQALADYDRAIELNSGWFESWGARARARALSGNAAGAVEDATRALQLHPDWGEALNTRGIGQSKLGNSREALADFSAALERRPQFVEARFNRATERAKIGDLDGALSDLDAAIQFDPQPQLHVRRGMTRAMKQDLRGAVADFSRALELAPPDWPQRRQVEQFLQRARSEIK